jgi:hypothetical protein
MVKTVARFCFGLGVVFGVEMALTPGDQIGLAFLSGLLMFLGAWRGWD